MAIDAITLVLLLLIISSKAYIVPALFALGFAYAGVAKELLFQIEKYNYPTERQKSWYNALYYIVPFVIAALVAPFAPAASVFFIAAFLFMTVMNNLKYSVSADPERIVEYDMMIFIPFIIGVIGLFYVFFGAVAL